MKAEELATKIATTFNTRPVRMGREWRTYCPHHEADGGMHKPSLAIWDYGDKIAIKCMTGCSKPSVAAALRERGVAFGQGGRASPEQALAMARMREEHRVTQLRKIEEIMTEAEPILYTSPQDRYLLSRGLGPLKYAEQGTLFAIEDPMFRGDPALLACIVDPTTLVPGDVNQVPRLVGLSILSLLDDGSPRISDKTGKKLRSVIGTQRGFGVPFGKPGSHLVIAEGLESMLAARQLLNIEFGIASLAAPNMPMIKIPEYVQRVTIVADHDEAGLNASAELMTDLGHLGIETRRVVYAGGNGWDAADELMRRK
jgi:hypothetical protein